MKKTNLFAALFALLSLISLSSCLNTGADNSYNYDIYARFVSVKSYMGMYYLVDDFGGTVYNPTSQSILDPLKKSDGTYYERVIVNMNLKDGEKITAGKTSYDITGMAVYNGVPYLKMTTRPDTLKGDYSINSLGNSQYNFIWASNGFINVPFKYFLGSSQASVSDFQMYVDKAEDDTLFTRFCKVTETSSLNVVSDAFISYKMPFSDSNFNNIYSNLVPVNDSIIIKVTSVDKNSKNISITTKYRYNER